MRALLTIIATVFALCGYAQDAKTIESRPNSYNYLRGVEAVQMATMRKLWNILTRKFQRTLRMAMRIPGLL